MLRLIGVACCAFAGAVVAVAAGGCTTDPYRTIAPVNGTVTCDGKPATGGTVTFTPVDSPEQTGRAKGAPGVPSTAMVGEDGRFTLKREAIIGETDVEGALVGPHQVTFALPQTVPYEVHPVDKANMPPEELEQLQAKLAKMPIFKPLACGVQISPGMVDVKSGSNDFSFTLRPATGPQDVTPPARRRGGPQ